MADRYNVTQAQLHLPVKPVMTPPGLSTSNSPSPKMTSLLPSLPIVEPTAYPTNDVINDPGIHHTPREKYKKWTYFPQEDFVVGWIKYRPGRHSRLPTQRLELHVNLSPN